MNQPTSIPEYDALTTQGLQLSKDDFTTIVTAITQGTTEAKKYLDVTNDSWPQFLFSDSASVLGYASQFDAINLPIRYLNAVAKYTTPLTFKDQMICSVQGKSLLVIKYTQWLRVLGWEATVHHYQKIGNSELHARFPETLPETMSLPAMLLSDVEVEARKTVDAIAESLGENALWEQFDADLAKEFTAYYNQPVSSLITLPRPELLIDYEMESIWPNIY